MKDFGNIGFARAGIVVGAVAVVLGGAYAADWYISQDRVPRGVTVAGVSVGGESRADAEAHLRSELEPRTTQPVTLRAADVSADLDPAAAGLTIDWDRTFASVGAQPANPFTRVASFFVSRDVSAVAAVDDAALTAAVEGVRGAFDRDAVEGDVVFDGVVPVAVEPRSGIALDVPAAQSAIEQNWLFGSVDVPVTTTPVTVSSDTVADTVRGVAADAVSGPVTFTGRTESVATLTPEQISTVVAFEPDGQGGLRTTIDSPAATASLAPQLASTEVQPRDGTVRLVGGSPTVVPEVDGDMVDWQATLAPLSSLLQSDPARTAQAVYAPVRPARTTEQAQNLGIKEVIGEFKTSGFEYASGVNIRLTADIVNGAVVDPGNTFSLNGYTGPRGFDQGFVESGIINNGRPARAIGGGISQFATTLYNASYFAGLEDVDHTEHSYYISRYPEAREATVFEGAIDLVFRNSGKTGILIESFGDSSSVTVRIWGTKTVDVESITGERTNFTSPNQVRVPAGQSCVASRGAGGFTASDTRVITDAASGSQISRTTRTVEYDPVPVVTC